MAFGAQIIADSLSPDGVRLTTFSIDFPRYIQAEVNTHRMLSKNSASSRAIPVPKMLQRLYDDPYTPVYWGTEKKGMQAGAEMDEMTQKLCLDRWLEARDDAMEHVRAMHKMGLHKQDANRLLEPWMWQTIVITGTEWSNFFNLRNNPDAHPAFQTVAAMMQELYEELEPIQLDYGQWHLPLVQDDSILLERVSLNTLDPYHERWIDYIKMSVGRCARTSTLTHDGIREPRKDIALHDKLLTSGHMSPFEHQARPAETNDCDIAMVKLADVEWVYGGLRRERINIVRPVNQWHGNFRGWVQYRKTIPNESDIMGSL